MAWIAYEIHKRNNPISVTLMHEQIQLKTSIFITEINLCKGVGTIALCSVL